METPPAGPHEVWERTPPEAQTHLRALAACLETLASMVHAGQEQVRTLQEQLHHTSQNASRRPASDPPPHGRPRRPRSQRRRGGQPGPPGQTRTLIPVADVAEVVGSTPEPCAHCQAPLSGDDRTPWRHHVIEMPPIEPVVTAYPWHQLMCSACGAVPRAPWPPGGPSGTYGPRVPATGARCTGSYRLSKRTTQQLMDDVLGVPLRVGTLSRLAQATTKGVAEPGEEACPYVHAQEVAHLEETRWRQGGKRAWLWGAVTSWVTVFVMVQPEGEWLRKFGRPDVAAEEGKRPMAPSVYASAVSTLCVRAFVDAFSTSSPSPRVCLGAFLSFLLASLHYSLPFAQIWR